MLAHIVSNKCYKNKEPDTILSGSTNYSGLYSIVMVNGWDNTEFLIKPKKIFVYVYIYWIY